MALTVEQAAARLGVAEREVRRLLSAGELGGERFGGSWMVDAWSVARRAALRPGRGRPWVPRVAWAALWLLSGLDVSWLSSGDLSRLRRRLQGTDPVALAGATRARASLDRVRVLPEYLDSLVASPEVVRGGVSAAEAVAADVVSTGVAEIYCASHVRGELFTRYGVQESTSNPNLYVRVPAIDNLPVLTDRHTMPAGVVAVDLLDSIDPRTVSAGHDLAEQLLQGIRA